MVLSTFLGSGLGALTRHLALTPELDLNTANVSGRDSSTSAGLVVQNDRPITELAEVTVGTWSESDAAEGRAL
jgi:hypothetical protein